MEYLSARETAEKWAISRRRVQLLCEQGRIEGIFKVGEVWAIPADAKKPDDGRLNRWKKDGAGTI
ncbi:MAG: DNA-binding protein [Erysipelothrix sp.]